MRRTESGELCDGNAELMRKTAGGDFEAFECLYRRFGPALRYFLAKWGLSAESRAELVQNIFADLWEKRAHFRAASSFETYLFAIARNTLGKEMRRARAAAETGRKDHPEHSGQSYNGLAEPEAEFYLKELQGAIEQAKGKLTDRQRQALNAANAVDIPLDEALEQLGCSRGAFNTRLRRARKRMREILAPFLDHDSDSDRT